MAVANLTIDQAWTVFPLRLFLANNGIRTYDPETSTIFFLFVKSNKASIDQTRKEKKCRPVWFFESHVPPLPLPASFPVHAALFETRCKFSLFVQHRGCLEKYPHCQNIGPFGYWLVTECVYRRWRMKSAGIGETVRKRVLLTDPLSRQRVFKRLQFFMFKNMIWKCETIVKLFVYTKMYI